MHLASEQSRDPRPGRVPSTPVAGGAAVRPIPSLILAAAIRPFFQTRILWHFIRHPTRGVICLAHHEAQRRTNSGVFDGFEAFAVEPPSPSDSRPGQTSQPAGIAPEMVIVTPQRFEADLRPLVEHRSRELAVQVATLETVLGDSAGVDDPEKLKRFLYRAWKERHLRYVLLVGDSSLLPVRYMVLDRVTPAAYDYAFYPSDLYYADVAKQDGSFDDWNAQKDGISRPLFR